jgi:SAM-dependent methyltransferase
MSRHYATKPRVRQEGSMSRTFTVDLVRRYYERHTRAFVTFGEGGPLGAMHRAVVAPETPSKAAAFRYVEDLIVAVAKPLVLGSGPLHVIDLGCGVGGSLCYLAEQLPILGIGITLSPTQATLARGRIARAGLSDRVTVVAGDYAVLPKAQAQADLVFAIESFVHATDAAIFVRRCARLLRPGGALVICDDFLRDGECRAARLARERFRRGWHINTLIKPAELRRLAGDEGLFHESTVDLSRHVDIGRPRDRIMATLAGPLERLPWRWPRLDPWLGGNALQQCLRRGWIGYDFVVFRRGS